MLGRRATTLWVGWGQRSFWVGSVEIRVSEGVGVNGARSQDGASVMALTMPGSRIERRDRRFILTFGNRG